MNCQPKSLSIMTISKSVPTGSGELTPDKPIKKGERRNKTSGLEGHDGGTVDEAGTSNPSGIRGCQFHAQWRREADTAGWAYRERLSFKSMYEDPRSHRKFDFEKESYVVLDAKGDGVYVGAHLDVDCFHRNPDDWYGEGDDLVFIDGEERPSIHGTGTEDWCNCAYSPTEEYNSPYNGIILHSGTRSWPWKGKQTLYRYHVEDPIRFKRSILVMIEHGHANGLSNDYSSTAYYYLSRPARGGPEIPPVQERLPRPDEEVYRAER